MSQKSFLRSEAYLMYDLNNVAECVSIPKHAGFLHISNIANDHTPNNVKG